MVPVRQMQAVPTSLYAGIPGFRLPVMYSLSFSFLWQEFLNVCGDLPDEALDDAKFELFNWYAIEGFGEVVVRGFED